MVEEERGGVPGWGENPLIPTQRERWLTANSMEAEGGEVAMGLMSDRL